MISFDPASHQYAFNGVVWPSVTQILRGPPNPYYTPRAADRGTAVHAAIALDLAGELDEETLDPAVAPYLLGFRQFMLDVMPISILSEEVVFSEKYQYAGTMDWYGSLAGRRCIVDFKTGKPPGWAGMQMAAYAQALAECRGLEVEETRVLALKPGGYKLLNPGLLSKNLELFLHQLGVFNAEAQKGCEQSGENRDAQGPDDDFRRPDLQDSKP